MSNGNKDGWDRLQVVFTIATAITTGIWGGFIYFKQWESNKTQEEINAKQQVIAEKLGALDRTIKSVDTMGPYFDRIVDKDIPKSKLAAYALYMLNKEDPQMAVKLILAADKKELREVLVDIGKMNSKIDEILQKDVPKLEEQPPNQPKSEMTKAAEKVLQAIHETNSGWCYLGDFKDGRWLRKTINIDDQQPPKEGATYGIIDEVYLRNNKPSDKGLGDVIRVNRQSERMRVEILEKSNTPDKNWVWAWVTIVP